MSKKIIYFMMLAFSLTIFSGCSDDDDDPVVTTDYATDIKGTYGGDLTLTLPSMDPQVTTKDIVVERTAANKVQVTLDEITVPNGLLDLVVTGIIVKDVPVTKSGDTYSLTKTEQNVEVSIATVAGTAKQEVKVVVSGTVKNNLMALDISVTVPVVGEIPVTFSGDKK